MIKFNYFYGQVIFHCVCVCVCVWMYVYTHIYIHTRQLFKYTRLLWALGLLQCLGYLLYIMLQWTQQCIYLFELVFWVSLNIYPEVELLGHKAVLFFIFLGTSILFSIVAVTICIPTNSTWGFPFLLILTNIYSSFIYNCHSDRCDISM